MYAHTPMLPFFAQDETMMSIREFFCSLLMTLGGREKGVLTNPFLLVQRYDLESREKGLLFGLILL